MIDAPRLLADLIRQLKGLEDDLRARLLAPAGTEAVAEPALQTLSAELRAEWEAEHRPWWKRVFGDHDDDDVPDADGANAHPSPRERHPR